jgi:hypothetical protein
MERPDGSFYWKCKTCFHEEAFPFYDDAAQYYKEDLINHEDRRDDEH